MLSSIEKLPSIFEVIDNDLCIACGACIEACIFTNISPSYSEKRGAHEVRIDDSTKCLECHMPCDAPCPSIRVDFRNTVSQRNVKGVKVEFSKRGGGIKSTYLAYSSEHRNGGISSSGGVIREMICHQLELGTPVVCLAVDPDDGQLKARLLTELSEIKYVPGSIYNSISFVGAIDCLRKATKPVMLVSIPCHLAGVKQYIREVEPKLQNKIDVVCGIVCGWMYSDHSIKAFTEFKNIQGDVTSISYRGSDRVGQLQLTVDEKVHSFARKNFSTFNEAIDYQSAFSTDYNRLRCRLCEDHLNQSADLIAGDAWLQRTIKDKVSILGIRTEKGNDLILEMIKTKRLGVEEGSFEDFIESQSANLVYNFEARKMSTSLRQKGKLVPEFMFDDWCEEINVSIVDNLNLLMEFLRRALIREKKYRTYRWFYIIRRYRVLLGFIKKMIM